MKEKTKTWRGQEIRGDRKKRVGPGMKRKDMEADYKDKGGTLEW